MLLEISPGHSSSPYCHFGLVRWCGFCILMYEKEVCLLIYLTLELIDRNTKIHWWRWIKDGAAKIQGKSFCRRVWGLNLFSQKILQPTTWWNAFLLRYWIMTSLLTTIMSVWVYRVFLFKYSLNMKSILQKTQINVLITLHIVWLTCRLTFFCGLWFLWHPWHLYPVLPIDCKVCPIFEHTSMEGTWSRRKSKKW